MSGPLVAPDRQSRESHTVAPSELEATTVSLFARGYRLALVAAHDDGDTLRAVYLFLAPAPRPRVEVVLSVPADRPHLPTLAAHSFAAGRFEREMHDLFGIVPVDHPLPRRLVRHGHWPAGWYPMRRDAATSPPATRAEPYPFLAVEGPGVYEIPVGPVHAGLIEPGHFRFSVVGEAILKMKARLWFVHRGVERLFEGRSADAGTELADRIAGDTTVGHALAHALAVEDALGLHIDPDTQLLRAMLLEFERLYNHAADIGALANDVGYGIINAHALRLREHLLRINDTLTGHRLLRGAIHVGGIHLRTLPDPDAIAGLAAELVEVADLALANSVVRERFTGTAVLPAAAARDLGCLGYVARASGLPIDARRDHPTITPTISPTVHQDGDVLARYRVRRDEVLTSAQLIGELADHFGGPLVSAPIRPPRSRRPRRSGVGIVEGWRGTIVHRVEIDAGGRFTRAKVVDPSWFNWPALPVALRDAIVPDFPLANKSFNCSYAGNDL